MAGSYASVVLSQCALVLLLKKVSLGAAATPSHCPAFLPLQLSGKPRVCLSPVQSRPTSSPSSKCCQDSPHSLALSCCPGNHCPSLGVPPAVCVPACLPQPPHERVFMPLLEQVCDLPILEGEGAARPLSLICFSPDGFPWQP